MSINWIYASAAIIAGTLGGLYIVGKLSQKKQQQEEEPKIKIKGKDIEDLEQKLRDRKGIKNIVDFEIVPIFTYESLVEWIKGVDIKDIDKEAANYGCMIVRSSKELDQFNLDLTGLTQDQKENIFGALIVNTENNQVIAQRWFVCELDDDLLNVFGNDNIKILK